MKENRIGIIVCSILVLVSGILPLFFLECTLFINYMLAVFGSGMLSLIICIINYCVIKKKSLIDIIQDDYFVELHAKMQVELTKEERDELTLSQVIEYCLQVRRLYSKALHNIDLYLSGTFSKKSKGNKLIKEYRNIISKSGIEYTDMYFFLTTSRNLDVLEIKEEFNNYLFNLVTNIETINKKNEVMNYFFKSTEEKEDDFSCDEFIENYKQKLKTYKCREQKSDIK